MRPIAPALYPSVIFLLLLSARMVSVRGVRRVVKQVVANLVTDTSLTHSPETIPTIIQEPSSFISSPSKVLPQLNKDRLSAKSLSRVAEQQAAGDATYIIGLDEAGRGPLAGPVVCAACYIPLSAENIPGIADSKLLNEVEREHLFALLTSHPQVKYATSVVSHQEIDEINILQATLTGMKRAAESLLGAEMWSAERCVGLVDGNKLPPLSIPCKAIVQGDRRIYSIAAASIIAKVTRDRIMQREHERFPFFKFDVNKGYPTAEHRALLLRHGPCEIHRITYAPVKKALEYWEGKKSKAGEGQEDKGESKEDGEEEREKVGGRGKRRTAGEESTAELPQVKTKRTRKSTAAEEKRAVAVSSSERSRRGAAAAQREKGEEIEMKKNTRKVKEEAQKNVIESTLRRSSRIAERQKPN